MKCLTLEPPVPARHAVLLLHGLGASAADLLPLAEQLEELRAEGTRFVLPEAPVRPVSVNGGMPMPAWYDIAELYLAEREDEAGIRAAARQLQGLVAAEQERGIPAARVVLAGFSQGGALSLHTGLRAAAPLAGIAVLSGYLPLAAALASEITDAGLQTPILMQHGTLDPVVVPALAERSRALLEQAGCRPLWQVYPVAHAIHPQQVEALRAWLHERHGTTAP